MKQILILSIALVIIIISFLYPKVMLNPGELTLKHQDLKDNCLSCHKPFWGIDKDNCISCHKLSEIGLNKSLNPDSTNNISKTLFHSKLKNPDCSSCHTEHEGINSNITKTGFDHDLLGIETKANCSGCHQNPMDKLHKQLTVNCSSCHNTKNWKLEGSFDHNMISEANKNDCRACHNSPDDDFHISLKDNCSKCHNTEKWKPSNFDHSMYFILDKNHDSKCITCHAENNFSEYTCYGCHEHNERDIFRKHEKENINNISDCASCHKSGDEHDIKGRDDKEFKNESNEKYDSGEKELRNKKDKEHKKNKVHDDLDDDEDDDD